MPLTDFMRRRPAWALSVTVAFGLCLDPIAARPVDAGLLSILGARAWRPPVRQAGPPLTPPPAEPRVNVLETDGWRQSLRDGRLEPVPQLPFPRASRGSTDLLPKAHFTPAAYLEQIKSLQRTYSRQRDILMYYGGIRYRPNREGLNFNAWSGENLAKLRALGARPFIGLEAFDLPAVRSMVWRLKEAGYGPLDRIYIRIGSEPAASAYGTEDGTRRGRRRTPAAYAAYRGRFARTAEYLNAMNRRIGLNIHTVFAGTHREDFTRYAPPDDLFDAIGYDLYVTPENKPAALRQIRDLSRRYPRKPLVIPEFGIATERHARGWWGVRTLWADPQWAAGALADVLEALGRHPAGVGGITIFSVNVSGRRSGRRWNWAWTPQMYEMLKEWQASPRRWRKEGFHLYDPQSYPVGRDILFINRPELKIVYRKLVSEKSPGVPLFQEFCLYRENEAWARRTRVIYFHGSEKRQHLSRRPIL